MTTPRIRPLGRFNRSDARSRGARSREKRSASIALAEVSDQAIGLFPQRARLFSEGAQVSTTLECLSQLGRRQGDAKAGRLPIG